MLKVREDDHPKSPRNNKKPTALEKRLLKTLQYYAEFSSPLTAWQLWWALGFDTFERKETSNYRYKRWQRLEFSLQEIQETLEKSSWLRGKGLLKKNQCYALKHQKQRFIWPSQKKFPSYRIQNWKKVKIVTSILSYLPFVKMIAVSGSLATSHDRPQSDIDLFIIGAAGRLWLVRLMAVSFLFLLRLYRRSDKTAGRFCLNHFVSDKGYLLDHRNIYTARLFSQLIVVYNLKNYQDFQSANLWIKKFIPRYPWLRFPSFRVHEDFWLRKKIKESMQWILEGFFGDIIEKISRRLQLYHIRKDKRRLHPKAQVVLTDSCLRFHLKPQEDRVLRKFAV